MNAHRLRQLVAWAALAACLLPGPLGRAELLAAPVAKAPEPTQSAAAQALADEALRPKAKRVAPRRLDVNLPVQVSFETGAVQQADITPDGKLLALARLSGGYSELWLRSLDPGLSLLPRRLAPALADRLSPALSPDGKRLAFVGMEDDIKGDIYLLDLTRPDATAQRLTGGEAEDGAPVFAPDGRALYFHQRLPGQSARRIVTLGIDAPGGLREDP